MDNVSVLAEQMCVFVFNVFKIIRLYFHDYESWYSDIFVKVTE